MTKYPVTFRDACLHVFKLQAENEYRTATAPFNRAESAEFSVDGATNFHRVPKDVELNIFVRLKRPVHSQLN
jgi:hypothetical protein